MLAVRVLFSVAIIASLAVTIGLSQEPTPRDDVTAQPEQAKPESTQQVPASDQPQAAQPPIIVNVLPAPKSEEERAEEAKERREKAELDRQLVKLTGELTFFTAALFYATGALAIATILLVAFAFRQSRDTQASIAIAKQSADAATLNAKAAVAAERAYIAGGVNFRNEHPGDHMMLVTMGNYGKTPAFIGTVAVGTCPEEQLEEMKDRPKWKDLRFKGYILPYNPDVKNPLRSDVLIQAPAIGDVVFGRIWYRDVFNKYHSSGFALYAQDGLPAVPGHDEYWKECEECDLGPTTHPPFV
jgi:hypothetical protein